MTLNAYSNRFSSVKRSNRAMSWNACDISTAMFPVLCVFWWKNMAPAVENISWNPWKYHLRDSKFQNVPWLSRTWACGASSKTAYYSLPACYLKTFWQPWYIHSFILHCNQTLHIGTCSKICKAAPKTFALGHQWIQQITARVFQISLQPDWAIEQWLF